MKNIEKAAQIIKLLVLDVDGVMTDGSIYLDAEQELFKSFNAKDGMGISCAIRCGLQVAIITGRCSPIIRRRARELGIVEVCENVKEKRSALAELLQKYNLSLNETAYVGDDLNDLPVLTQVGLACAPADAVEEVKQVCHFVAEKKGGCGAVTACDCCIYFAREFGYENLYPYDSQNLTKESFIAFSKIMKPYLSPRMRGN